MKRKGNPALIVATILVVAIVSVLYIYNNFYLTRLDQYNTYLGVKREPDQTIDSIYIESINHDVIIKSTEEPRIRIDYYQKPDNTDTYQCANGVIEIKFFERVENLNNIFFTATNKINAVTIYVPADSDISIHISTIDGSLKCEDVVLNKMEFETVVGNTDIKNSDISFMNIVSNSGYIHLSDNECDDYHIVAISGEVNLTLKDSMDLYKHHVLTNFGSLLHNGGKIYQEDESGTIVSVNALNNDDPERNKNISLVSTRSVVKIESVELLENNEQQQE